MRPQLYKSRIHTLIFNFKCKLSLYLLSLVLKVASSMAPEDDDFYWESYDVWSEELWFDVETVQQDFIMFLPQEEQVIQNTPPF